MKKFAPQIILKLNASNRLNIQHRTLNNDVALLYNLISFIFKNYISNLEC